MRPITLLVKVLVRGHGLIDFVRQNKQTNKQTKEASKSNIIKQIKERERIMVFSSLVVVTVARVSGEAWQWVACIGEQPPLTSDQLLDLLCCFPLHQLGRVALCLCSFFCLPQPDSYYSYLPSDDDDDDDESSSTSIDYDDFYYHSHSD